MAFRRGNVTLLDGSTAVGTATLTAGSAKLTWTASGLGTHSFTARYNGDATYASGTSAPVSVKVT